MPEDEIEKGAYLHAKTGRKYEVIGMALQTETQESLVIYRPLYDSEHELFARPAVMFSESVMVNGKTVPRFERIND